MSLSESLPFILSPLLIYPLVGVAYYWHWERGSGVHDSAEPDGAHITWRLQAGMLTVPSTYSLRTMRSRRQVAYSLAHFDVWTTWLPDKAVAGCGTSYSSPSCSGSSWLHGGFEDDAYYFIASNFHFLHLLSISIPFPNLSKCQTVMHIEEQRNPQQTENY